MVNANPLQSAWNAGELSPRLAARTNFDKYKNGASVLENMIPLTEGGATRRSGTRYVADVKTGTSTTRLKPFQFSTTQTYPLEFGDEYIRFFRNQGQIAAGATDGSVTNGTFGSDIAGWNTSSSQGAGYAAWSSSDGGSMNFTLVSSSDTADVDQTITVSSSLIANEHIAKFHVIGNAGDALTFKVGTSSSQTDLVSAIEKPVGYHAVPFTPNSTQISLQFSYLGTLKAIDVPSSGSWQVDVALDDVEIISNSILELQSPWGSSQLFELEGPQSADVLYLLNNNTAPHKLTRRGHTDWSFEQPLFIDGPYLDQNNTDTTLSTNSTDGRQVTVTASAVTGINDGGGFGSSDIGRLIRLSAASTSAPNWGWGLIIGSTGTTTVTVDVKRDFPSTNATTEWRLGSWSDETGWPGVGAFHQQRLVLARSTDQPQTKWYSQTGDFENMAPDSASSSEWDGTVESDDALTYTISSDDVEDIEWMTAGTTLQVGTRNAEWSVASDGAAITPTDILVSRHTQHGSARVQPVRVGHATLFLQRAKRRVRELAFNFEADGLVANDLSRLAPHITVGGITEMAYQQEPDSIVWGTRSDGQLLSMTYRREEDVTAWSRHIIGGSYGSSNAVVESVITIPGSTASGQTQDSLDRDEIWVVAKRTINGSTVRYVEFFERDYEEGDSQEDSYYSDSLLTYDSTATTSLTGAAHIAVETAKVLANGAIHTDVEVSSSGAATLNVASSTVQIGLGYTHRMHTFKLDAGATAGTAQGATKRIKDVNVSLLNSHVLKIGPSSSQLDTFDFREVGDEMDTAVPFFTGDQLVEMESDWQKDPRIVIEDDSPAPFTLLALVPRLKTHDLK